MAVALAAAAGRSWAADECGPATSGGAVTCSGAFPAGISYVDPAVTDLTIVIDDNAVIDTTGSTGEPGGIITGGAGGFGGRAISGGTAGGAGIVITTDDDGAGGIAAETDNGDIIVNVVGAITTSGDLARGIDAQTRDGDAVIVVSGEVATAGARADGVAVRAAGSVGALVVEKASTEGELSGGIDVFAEEDIVALVSGAIATKGNYASGIQASATNIVSLSSGSAVTQGNYAYGLYARATDKIISVTSDSVTTKGTRSIGISVYALGEITSLSSGKVVTSGYDADGVRAYARYGDIVSLSAGDIATSGTYASGVYARAGNDLVSLVSGSVATAGDYAHAIDVVARNNANLVIDKVDTAGNFAIGILAGADKGALSVYASDVATGGFASLGISVTAGNEISNLNVRSVRTKGDEAYAVVAAAYGGNIVSLTAGSIVTTGRQADGVHAYAAQDANAGVVDIAATGLGSRAIYAKAGAAIRITVSGQVIGGGGGGGGILLDAQDSSLVAIAQGGAVGALSDLAVSATSGATLIDNRGTVNGSARLASGDDKLLNGAGGHWGISLFQDSDGDGVRETELVALSDFGAGDDLFLNEGTLALSTIQGATTVNGIGQLAHPGGGPDITADGVEQGQFVQLESFVNRGAIVLSDGVAGDVLVITDQAVAGSAGDGVFRSEGGILALDVVLDDGAVDSSDILIVDRAELGASGPTRILVSNVGGKGGQTKDDGILLVSALSGAEAGAFALAGPVVAGAFAYDLVFKDSTAGTDGFFLQSRPFSGASEYPSILVSALTIWQGALDGEHQRMRDMRRLVAAEPTASAAADTYVAAAGPGAARDLGAWLRVTGSDLDVAQEGGDDFAQSTVRTEAGFDAGFRGFADPDDALVLGAMAGYGSAHAAFDTGAQLAWDIASIGAYGTYFSGPFYIDGLVRLDYLSGDFTSSAVTRGGGLGVPVFGVSFEAGYRLDLPASSFFVEPSAQIAYAHAESDTIVDDSGERIRLDEVDSFAAQATLRGGRSLDGGPAAGTLYVEASARQEFLGESRAIATGIAFEQELPGTSWAFGAGMDIEVPENGITLTFDADYVVGGEVEGIEATGGIRITW